MVSKTYSPCAISEVGEEKSSSRLGILAQQEIPEHLPATPTDAGSHNSFFVGSLCRVRDDKRTFQKAAFTLAEVLITLGIIGVVAAMTIPTLVANYKKKVVETRLVKVYSTFNQAIKMSEAEHGPLTTWDAIEETMEYDDENQSYIITESNIVDWYDKYIAPYIKTAKVDKNITTDKDKKIKVWMPDGSLVLISSSSWLVYPNANDYSEGEYGENTGLTDRNKDDCGTKYFTFYFNPRTTTATPKYHYGKGLEPYLSGWDGTEEMLRNDDRLGCREESVSNERAYCTQLIRMNNWKIPDDYPLKF